MSCRRLISSPEVFCTAVQSRLTDAPERVCPRIPYRCSDANTPCELSGTGSYPSDSPLSSSTCPVSISTNIEMVAALAMERATQSPTVCDGPGNACDACLATNRYGSESFPSPVPSVPNSPAASDQVFQAIASSSMSSCSGS